MTQTKDSKLALAQVSLSGFLFGCLGYFGMSLLREGFSLNAMLFWRFFLSGLFVLLIVLVRKQFFRPNIQQLVQFFRWSLYYSGCSGLYFLAATYVGTGLAMVVFFTFPAFVILISWLKKERDINFITLLTLAVLALGISLLHGKSDSINFDIFGIVVACLAAVSYALFIVETGNRSREIGSLNIVLYVSLGTASIFLLFALFRQEFAIPDNFEQGKYLLGISLLATAFPMLLMLFGLSGMEKGRAAVLSVLEPVVTVIVGHLFLGEALSSTQCVGIALILGSVICVQFE